MKKRVNIVGTLILVLLGIIVFFVFKKRIERMIRNIKSMKAKKKEEKLLEQLGISPSFSQATINSMATELHEAVYHSWYDWNCNEFAINKVLTRLNNDLDYNQLSRAFGVRDTYDMETYINSCLNFSEKRDINLNWEAKGMTKRI